MIVAACMITSSVWMGYELVFWVSPAVWDQVSVLAAGVPVGFALCSWMGFGVHAVMRMNRGVGVVMCVVMGLCAYFLHGKNKKAVRVRRFRVEFWVMLGVVSLLYLRLTDMSMLKNATGSSGTTYSDLPFHMSLISSFVYGANNKGVQMQTPFYAGEKLCYPIIPDFHAATLMGCGGASIRVALAVPTVLLLLALTIALYSLAQQYTKVRFVPELSIILFLLASGSGWRWWFVPECRNNPNVNFVHSLCSKFYTFWIHSLVHFLMPQRSAIYSMTLVVSVTSLLFYFVESKFKDTRAAILAGIMMGLLPMISAHSYIGVGEYAIFLCIETFPFIQWRKWKKQIIAWTFFGVTAILLSLPQVLWLMRVKRSGFMKWHPIWRDNQTSSNTNFFTLWWRSLGAFCVIAILFAWFAQNSRQRTFYIPAFCVWLVSNFIQYQPGIMDNTKVFFAGWYSLACIAVAHYAILVFTQDSLIAQLAIAVALLGSSFGGSVCIYKAATHKFPLFNKDEVALGKWTMQCTPINATVLSSGWHANTAMSIGGRLVTIGYPGWVWSHGLDIGPRRSMMRTLIHNRENTSLFLSRNIKYVLSKSDDHKRSFNFSKPGPTSHWLPVVDIGNIQLYRLLTNI